jgi:tRNA dimethylallyltransferase
VPENRELRERLGSKSIDELKDILSRYIVPHNTSDLDTSKRAIRAIEIADYNLHQPADYKEFEAVDSIIVGIDIDRNTRRLKISERLKQRLNNGMIEEIKQLLSDGVSAEDLIYYGLEYKYITLFLTGKISYSDMFTELQTVIHQFAKRQMTWFRGMERRNFHIHWINAELSTDEKMKQIFALIESKKAE